jgi:mannosyltransferase
MATPESPEMQLDFRSPPDPPRCRWISHPHLKKDEMAEFRTSQRVILALVMLASAALTIPQLGLRSLWWDEGFSWWLTTVDLKDLWQITWDFEEINMFAYSGLLNIWSRWGDSEFWLRLPSALFAVGAVWAVARLGSILFEPRVGLTAALIMALNGFVVYYGQEARAYSMLLFFTTLSSYLLLRALKDGELRYWFGFVVVSILCGYTQVFGALQVFSQVFIVGFLVYAASKRVPKRLIITAGVVLLGMLPLIWFVLTKRGGIDWIPHPTLGSLALIVKSLVGGGVMLITYVPLIVFGFARRQSHRVPISGGGSFSPAAYVVLCFAVPMALVFGISLIRPLTVPRYLIATVAPLSLAAAVGIMAIPRRALRTVALVVVAALAFRSSVSQLARGTGEDFRSATNLILQGAMAGEVLLFCLPDAKMVFDYYARDKSVIPPTVYPKESKPYKKELLFGEPGAPSPDDIATLAAGYDRVWMLRTHDKRGICGPPLLAALGKTHVIFEEKEFPEVRVVLLAKRG